MFTDAEIRGLKPKPRDYIQRESTRQRGTGRLLVKVKASGPKEFYFQYVRNRRQRRVKIGNYPNTTLAAARKKVDEYTGILRDGKDVKDELEARQRAEALNQREIRRNLEIEQKRGTFGQLLSSYVAYLEANGSVSASQVKWSFKKYVRDEWPELMDKKAREVGAADIRDILARMISNEITTYTNRVRSRLHAAFQHGLKRDNDPRTYLEAAVQFGLEFNPVAGVPVQVDWERVGDRNLSTCELRAFWNSLPGKQHPVLANFYKFLLAIGGQRPQQVLRCDWTAYDLKANLLTIENHKDGGKPHVVPLNKAAMEILTETQSYTGDAEYPFSLRDPKSHLAPDWASHSLRDHLEQNDLPRFLLRDLRRTWKTLAGEAGVSKEVRDKIQGHAKVDVSSKHYDRYSYLKEKRRGLDQWDTFLTMILKGTDNVKVLKTA